MKHSHSSVHSLIIGAWIAICSPAFAQGSSDEFAGQDDLAGPLTVEIGPIPGLTTDWHKAPGITSIPCGSPFLMRASFPHPREPGVYPTIAWQGATLVSSNDAESIARVTRSKPGRIEVVAGFWIHSNGQLTKREQRFQFNVDPTPVESIRYAPIEVFVENRLAEGMTNTQTMRAYFGPESIARLHRLGTNRYATSIHRTIAFESQSIPSGFEPLMEWFVNDKLLTIGDSMKQSFSKPESVTVRVGNGAGRRSPRATSESVNLQIYKVAIHRLPAGLFQATTEPPGFEKHIQWLSSTKYGTATPTLGRGPFFAPRFRNTFGASGSWTGVKCDNDISGSDTAPSCEIEITATPTNWLPMGRLSGTATGTPGNSVSFKATIKKGGPQKIKFVLTKVSTEPGVCMNLGSESDSDNDLMFLAADNPAFSTPSPDGLMITSKAAVNSITVTVRCFDWGAFGRIKAICLHPNAPSEAGPVTIPWDDNNNNIADSASQDSGPVGKTGPADDLDNSPNGDGTDGDELSRYEEYRGFMIRGTHERTNVLTKDVFIHNAVGQVDGKDLGHSGYFQTALLTAPVYAILKSEMNNDREINYNNSSHHIGKQTAVLVTNGSAKAACRGALGAASVLSTPWVPNRQNFCYVCVDNIEAPINAIDTRVGNGGVKATETEFLPAEKSAKGAQTPGRTRIGNEIIEFKQTWGSRTSLRGDYKKGDSSIQVRGIGNIFANRGILRIENEILTYSGTVQQETALDGDHSASVTTIDVASTAVFAATGTFHIGQEVISYTGKTPTSFTGCVRGAKGTATKTHRNGSRVIYAAFTGVVGGSFATVPADHDNLFYASQRMYADLTRGVNGTVAVDHSGGEAIAKFSEPNDVARSVFGHEAGHIVNLQHWNPSFEVIMNNGIFRCAWQNNGYWNLYINPTTGANTIDGRYRIKP